MITLIYTMYIAKLIQYILKNTVGLQSNLHYVQTRDGRFWDQDLKVSTHKVSFEGSEPKSIGVKKQGSKVEGADSNENNGV